jgi:iron complex transport system substrate-binding protein
MPRIVTMIASATEIVCALGFEDQLVARSHECDYPPSVQRLPVCTAPRFDVHGSSLDIDRRVKSLLENATSIYHVDADMLRALKPDVIVTQSHCEVCAVSEKDVEQALYDWLEKKPNIVSLSPNYLTDVWQSIRSVADALEVSSRGDALVQRLKSRVDNIAARVPESRPAVACLEWLDPLMAAGNWVPELVELAGGRNLFGTAGKHSPWMTWEELCERDPDIIVAGLTWRKRARKWPACEPELNGVPYKRSRMAAFLSRTAINSSTVRGRGSSNPWRSWRRYFIRTISSAST